MPDLMFANHVGPVTEEIPRSFAIQTSPDTDIWRKPPSLDVFNAPIRHRIIPLNTFVKARVTVIADWVRLYDQGGLLLAVLKSDGSKKWVKSGIEFVEGKPHISTVATDRWADWSLRPPMQDDQNQSASATMEMVKEGVSLWVYLIDGHQRLPIREVTWVFEDEASQNEECWIGVYAARPSKDPGTLEVRFDDFHIETRGAETLT
ncbi:MAG: hypothetical protein M1834_000647 [Cirrosporium novae-zelandiae]|nr:MAG: hypothetical protein M1834_000647 [Cirrosporium novae-zelandiae]